MKKYFSTYLLLTAVGICMAGTIPVRAASYFESAPKDIVVGKPFDVTFYAESQKDQINALSGTITYPADLLDIKMVKNGDSIISLWVRSPEAKAVKQLGTTNIIPFDGLMPGGTTFSKGKLFTITFVPKAAMTSRAASVTVQNGGAYLSDGKGTKITMSAIPLTIPKATIQTDVPKTQVAVLGERIDDIVPPQSLSASVAQSNSLFNGAWFVAFNAVDAESGIDHYEIQESIEPTPLPKAWIVSTNPYKLIDQKRASYIFVKAVDRAGNEKISIIKPLENQNKYTQIAIWCIIALLGASAVFVWLRKKRLNPISE